MGIGQRSCPGTTLSLNVECGMWNVEGRKTFWNMECGTWNLGSTCAGGEPPASFKPQSSLAGRLCAAHPSPPPLSRAERGSVQRFAQIGLSEAAVENTASQSDDRHNYCTLSKWFALRSSSCPARIGNSRRAALAWNVLRSPASDNRTLR